MSYLAHKGLEGLKSDSRRGSLLLPESRSRQGSIVLGGTERRGSYYHDDVTTRATVAMVTDDPEHKKNLKSGLAGAFGDGDLSKFKYSIQFLKLMHEHIANVE